VSSTWKLFSALALLFVANIAIAVEYYEDDRSGGSDVSSLPHYRSPEEACVRGVLARKVQGYQEGDNRQYRFRSANVGTDDGFSEYRCQGVIERQFFYEAAHWVTVEAVDTNVYGPFGGSETCTLAGYRDPETGQCGPPKCTDSCCDSSCGNGSNPIGTASGNKHQVETDFVGTGAFPLVFNRTYDSKRTWLANPIPIGIGWTHRYLASIVITPAQGSSTLSEAIVYRPDGRIQRFNLSGANWVSEADVSERLSVSISSGVFTGATYTTNDDEVETYDQQGRLISITNRGGFKQTLTYTTGASGSASTIAHNNVQTVTDPQGRSLTFGYTSGKLTSLTDGNGAVIQYGYDANGNLQTVTYPDVAGTKVRTYFYNESGQTGGVSQPNALTGIQDENTQRYASWGYTNKGLANLSVHGAFSGGAVDRTALAFNADGTTTVTDALSQARKFAFQVNYLVARYTALDQPCDYCGSNFTSRTYDTNGYPSGGTDFRGYQTGFTYNTRGLETLRDEAKTQTEERITDTSWNTTFRVPNQRNVSNHGGTIEARTDWTYNTRGQPTARCEVDLTTVGASSYTCASSGTTPAGIRRWTYTYCDAIDGTQCPLIGLILLTDGPRTDVADVTTYIYRMADDTATPPLFRKGDLWTMTNALGHVTEFQQLDGNGRPLRVKDINGVLIDTAYHPRGWLRTRIARANASGTPSANDAIMQTEYDGVGNVVKVTQPDGVFLSYAYDNAHRLTSITDNIGNHIDYTLDALGHRTTEKTFDVSDTVNPRRLLTRAYNTLSRMTDQYDAQTRDTQFGYDGNGNRTDETDPLGIKSHWTYDGLNRLATQIGDYTGTDASTADSTTDYSYDTRDNVTQIDDPEALTTTYAFGGLNNLKQLQSPDTGTTHYPTYDAAGNRLTQQDARGITWTMTYDALNRLRTTTFPTTSLDVAYTFDSYVASSPCAVTSYPVGRLTLMNDASGSTTYCYDQRGNIVQKIQVTYGAQFDTRYSYNLADRLMSMTYPSGAIVNYTRDANGRIQTVNATQPGGSATSILTHLTWQPFGPPITYTFASGGQTLTKTFDQNYWMTDVAGTALNLHFCRDAMSNITALKSTAPACTGTPNEQYAYDALYRLTHVEDATGGKLQDFTYNKTGDRLTKTLDPNPTQVYTYTPSTHRLDGVGPNARMLDANGNTTETTGSATLDFTFDDRNRMTAVKRNATPIASYDYNGKGERLYKSATYPSTDTRWFSYNEAGSLLGEYSETAMQEYIWVERTPIAILTTTGKSIGRVDLIFVNGFETPPRITNTIGYVHTDQLNTPRAITGTAGANLWSWSWQTNLFGEANPTGAIALNLRFPGQYFDDEMGLNYNYFRNYEPSTGRYVESDPIGLLGGNSTYSYVRASPLRKADFSGLWSTVDLELYDWYLHGDGSYVDISAWCQDYIADATVELLASKLRTKAGIHAKELANAGFTGTEDWTYGERNNLYVTSIYSFGAGNFHDTEVSCAFSGSSCCVTGQCGLSYKAKDLFTDPYDLHQGAGLPMRAANNGTSFWFGLSCAGDTFKVKACRH
jgi:RHS repeat-associated protein